MKLKPAVKIVALLLLALAALGTYLFFSARKRPNIILVTVDALRADFLGIYGRGKNTSPHIDAFAKNAVVFTNAYCAMPKTSASFASLLTGLHPFLNKTAPIQDYLREKDLTIAEFLLARGYETAAIVENANLSKALGFSKGFASYTEVWKHVNGKAAATPYITAETLKFLGKTHQKPFFLWVHYIDPHAPYLPPDEFVHYNAAEKGRDISGIEKKIIVGGKLEKQTIKNGQTDENYFIARYEGCVRYVDNEIGKILNILQNRYRDDTVVMLSSDHGEELGEHNLFFDHGPLTFQSSIRVPLIVKIPGKGNARIADAVSLLDIFPTIAADIVQQKIPVEIQGRSLFKADPERDLFIYGQFSHSIVSGHEHFMEINAPFAESLNLLKRYCFDIRSDPAEKSNLIEKRYPEFLQKNNLYLNYLNRHPYPLSKKRLKKLSEKDIENLKTLGYIN
jgi:arylsulfatase A-like enzyme